MTVIFYWCTFLATFTLCLCLGVSHKNVTVVLVEGNFYSQSLLISAIKVISWLAAGGGLPKPASQRNL